MLPFLKPKQAATTIIEHRKKDGDVEERHEESEHSSHLMECAEALISAVHNKDAKAVADVLSKLMEAESAIEEKSE